MKDQSIAIIGSGLVGTALGFKLNQCGYQIAGIASRRRESADKTHAFLGQGTVFDNLVDAARSGDIVLITTSDNAIAETCDEIAAQGGFEESHFVVHCSGALSSEVLKSARSATTEIGSLHPLQSFANLTTAVQNMSHISWGVEGDKNCVKTLLEIVEELEGHAFQLQAGHKSFYHTGAVTVSNFMVALLHQGVNLLQRADIDQKQAKAGLITLMEGTLNNLKTMDIADALTGPVARGDHHTVEKHLECLGDTPAVKECYQTLGAYLINLGLERGSLSAEAAESIQNLMAATPSQAQHDHQA